MGAGNSGGQAHVNKYYQQLIGPTAIAYKLKIIKRVGFGKNTFRNERAFHFHLSYPNFSRLRSALFVRFGCCALESQNPIDFYPDSRSRVLNPHPN